MIDFNGTKGPWQVGSETVSGDIRIIDPDGAMVAMTEVKTGDGYLWSPSTVAENANLISAAPELLEALQALKRELVLSDVDLDYIESHFRPHIDRARAAIAKALGQ